MKVVCAKTISRPKNPIMAAYGPDPFFLRVFYGFITGFLRVNCGFLKAGVLFKFRKYGFSTGQIRDKYGKMLRSPCFTIPKNYQNLHKSRTGCPNCHLPASKQKLNLNKRLHFPIRRSKIRIYIGFQVPNAALSTQTLSPYSALLLILVGMG